MKLKEQEKAKQKKKLDKELESKKRKAEIFQQMSNIHISVPVIWRVQYSEFKNSKKSYDDEL